MPTLAIDRREPTARFDGPAGQRGNRNVVNLRPAWAPQIFALMFGLLVAASLTWAPAVVAQGMGGGMGGGHGSHGNRGNNSATPANNADATPGHVPNPLRALQGEMSKLRTDLLLNATQIVPWSAMEDALRECVELNRSRLPAVNSGNPDPLLFAQDLAENEHALADATARFATAMKSALAALNPNQLQTSRQRLIAAIDGEAPHVDP